MNASLCFLKLFTFVGIALLAGPLSAQYGIAPPAMYDMGPSEGMSGAMGLEYMDDARSAASFYGGSAYMSSYGSSVRPGEAMSPEEWAQVQFSRRAASGAAQQLTPEQIMRQREMARYEQKMSQYEEEQKTEQAREQFWAQLAREIEQRDQVKETTSEVTECSYEINTDSNDTAIRDVPIELIATTQDGLVAYIHKPVWDILSVQQKGLLEERFSKIELLKEAD